MGMEVGGAALLKPKARAWLVLLLACAAMWRGGYAGEVPVELGRIPWTRDFDAARAEAERSGRPMMVLFDEVPGCRTCQVFGKEPLSHPIVVDAAQNFVPVAIYNNLGGRDAEVLARFQEPAWNNPVVRFMDAGGRDLIPRRQEYSTGALVRRMAEALEAAGADVPEYLRLVAAEYDPARPETAAFSMSCYWEGERKLGGLEGVIGTRIGTLHGREAVEVDFDAAVVDYRALVGHALDLGVASTVYARDEEQARIAREVVGDDAEMTGARANTSTQQQYHLAHVPEYHYLPLTALQATKVNAAIASAADPDRYLSPGQLELKRKLAVVARDPERRADLERLQVDRSPDGVIRYTGELRRLLGG